jgi:hypothetical protein
MAKAPEQILRGWSFVDLTPHAAINLQKRL